MRPDRWIPIVIVCVTSLGMFAIRLSAPPDLMDTGTLKPAAYLVDALENGNWICPGDYRGRIASKPPMVVWLSGGASLLFGGASRFTLFLPGALAVLGIALTLLLVGQAYFGRQAGLLGAVAFLLSPAGVKQVYLARTDAVFSLFVALAALAAFRAWRTGRGWTWFWLAAAAATLTKGPLGVVLAAGGLLAAWWERRSGRPTALRGPHTLGLILYIGTTLGWLALAYGEVGWAVIHRMLGQELLAHAVSNPEADPDVWYGFYKPAFAFLTRLAPWSLLAALGFWRVWRRPSDEDHTRRLERFAFCWFFVGLLIFSLAPHRRVQLIFPLLPAAALVAGREATQLLQKIGVARWTIPVCAGLCAAWLACLALIQPFVLGKDPSFDRTLGMKNLAAHIEKKVGKNFPLIYTDTPYALQFYLHSMRPYVSFQDAAELLRGEATAFIVVRDHAKLQEAIGRHAPPIHEVARWPEKSAPYVSILSNHPRLEWTPCMATQVGPIRLTMQNLRLARLRRKEFVFTSETGQGAATLTNVSDEIRSVRVRIVGPDQTVVLNKTLKAGESWRFKG